MLNNLFFKNKGVAPGTIVYEGDTPPQATKISAYKVLPNGVTIFTKEQNIADDGLVWIRVTGLADTEGIVKYISAYDINSLTLEDIFETYHNPKFDDTFDYPFIIMRSIYIDDRPKDNQISFILKNNTLITFEEYPCEEFEIVLNRVYKHYKNFSNRGSEYLLYALIDALIDNYLLVLNNINREVDKQEDSMTFDVSEPIDTHNLFNIKRQINFLYRHTRSSYEVVNHLLKRAVSADNAGDIVPYYEDLFEHSMYLSEVIQYCKDSIKSLYDENMSRIQIRSNKFINILTMLSTLMLPPMVIGGIFGMNFDDIPGTHSKYGFLASIAVMGGVSLLFAWFFKRKKYF